MDYIMINRYRTLVRMQQSAFAVVKYVVKCNTKFQNARVNSICLEFSLAYIFALLIATPIALYNVHAADCLPVQIGVTNEKTRQSETFNI